MEVQGRDWKAHAQKARLRWALETVLELSMQKRKERPSRLRGPGDIEAAQEMMKAGVGKLWDLKLGGALDTRKGVWTGLSRQQAVTGSESHASDPELVSLN